MQARVAVDIGILVSAGLLLGAPAGAVAGKVLVTTTPYFTLGDVVQIDCETGERTVLRAGGKAYGPGFSPDGSHIAFYEEGMIWVMRADGTELRELCATPRNQLLRHAVSWTLDDHVHFNEVGSNTIWRCDVRTGAREVLFESPNSPHMPSVALDSRRVGATRPEWSVIAIDVDRGEQRDVGAGCQGTLSPDGTLLTHNLADGEHKIANIHRFDDLSVYSVITAPAVDSDVTAHRFSRVSNRHIVFTDRGHAAYVVDIDTDTATYVGEGQAWDFYPAAGPDPAMALQPRALAIRAFVGALAPPSRPVEILQLGAVSAISSHVTAGGEWLGVQQDATASGSHLHTVVDHAALAPGTYLAAVEVAGEAARNSPQRLAVTLVVSRASAPLRVDVGAEDDAVAGWVAGAHFSQDGAPWLAAQPVEVADVMAAAPSAVYGNAVRGDLQVIALPLADGYYEVRLHLVGEDGASLVDWVVNEQTVAQDLDVAAAAGGPYRALVLHQLVVAHGGTGILVVGSGDATVLAAGLEVLQPEVPNAAPAVELAPVAQIVAGVPVSLNATITDDGLPTPVLELTWTQVQGPGEVTFATPGAVPTLATFATAGSYQIELAVSDGHLATRAGATLAVAAPPQPQVTLLWPVGGEILYPGEQATIRWTTVDLDDVALRFSADDGSTWETLAASVDTASPDWGAWPWTIPARASTRCRIGVSGYFDEASARSAAPFTIVVPGDGDGGVGRDARAPDPAGERDTAACACRARRDTGMPALAALLWTLLWCRRYRRR